MDYIDLDKILIVIYENNSFHTKFEFYFLYQF